MFGKFTPYLQANPYRPKTKNINPKKAERVDLTPPVVFQKSQVFPESFIKISQVININYFRQNFGFFYISLLQRN